MLNPNLIEALKNLDSFRRFLETIDYLMDRTEDMEERIELTQMLTFEQTERIGRVIAAFRRYEKGQLPKEPLETPKIIYLPNLAQEKTANA